MTNQLQFYTAMSVSNKERVMDKKLFEQGKRDCEEGIPHESGKGDSYDYGYSWQYAKEQEQ